MKRTLTTTLSIIIFFTFTLLIYLTLLKCFINEKAISKYLDHVSLTDKVNIKLNKPNYFIDNIKITYEDLRNMNFFNDQIRKIESDTQIDTVLKNIILNKVSYFKQNDQLNIYTKNQLDNILIKKISDDVLKKYIIENDYKIITFENKLNNTMTNYYSNIRFIFTNTFFIGIIILMVISSVLLIVINKSNSIEILSNTILVSNIFIILESMLSKLIVKFIFSNSIINYLFYDYFSNYVNITIIVSIVFAIGNIIIQLIYENSGKKKKIKPRLGKVRKHEENFDF